MIPKLFHRIWLGPRAMPQQYVEYAQSWVDHHPGWTLIDWTYGDEPGTLKPGTVYGTDDDLVGVFLAWNDDLKLINGEVFDGCGTTWTVRHGAGKAHSGQAVQRADIASYDLIYQLGGVYLNCDLECLKPIDDLLVECFTSWEIDGMFISNAMMGGTEEHPFWKACVEALPDRIRTMPHKPMNIQTGPHLITDQYNQWKARSADLPTVYPSKFFHPYIWRDTHLEGSDFPEAYAEHHWGHKAKDDDLWPDDDKETDQFPEFTQPTVVIGYIHDGTMRGETGLCISATLQHSFDRIERVWAGYSGPRISNGRNKLVLDFLNHCSSEWLMMIDTDMIFNSTAVADLLNSADPNERPIIGGLCFARRGGELYPTMYRMSAEEGTFLVASNVAYEQLTEVDATGAAFLLVHRNVLTAMYDHYPQPYRWFQESQIGSGDEAMEVGEDITFCLRARNLGFPIFVNTGVHTGHMKDTMLTAEMYEQQQRKESP